MPKFRGLPKGKRGEYSQPRQQRYNTPYSVNDWQTRPSRGNRKWSFFLRGPKQRDWIYKVDSPDDLRNQRSFRRLWCRSLPLIPIPVLPVDESGRVRSWEFISDNAPNGYWTVEARWRDDIEEQYCWREFDPPEPTRKCVYYYDEQGNIRQVCTELPRGIRYEYENKPEASPGNGNNGWCSQEIGVCRLTYIADASDLWNNSGNILPEEFSPSNSSYNMIVDLPQLAGGGCPDVEVTRDTEEDTLTWDNENGSFTGPNITFTVTENTATTSFDIYLSTNGGSPVYATTLSGSEISEVYNGNRWAARVEARGQCSSQVGWLGGHAWFNVASFSFYNHYDCGDRTTANLIVNFENGTMLDNGSSKWYLPPGELTRTSKKIETNLGKSYSYYDMFKSNIGATPVLKSASWIGNGSYNLKVFSNGVLVLNQNYTYNPSPILIPGDGSGNYTITAGDYTDGEFARNPGGSIFPLTKEASYYCGGDDEPDPQNPCTLVIYGGVTTTDPVGVEIGRITRSDGTCPAMPPSQSPGSGGTSNTPNPTPQIRCEPYSVPGDPYYETIWNETEARSNFSQYYYTCDCPYYSGQVVSLSSGSLQSSRSFSSSAPSFLYQQPVCKHIFAAMRANGDVTDADIPYDQAAEAGYYERLNTANYLAANPVGVQLQSCSYGYVSEIQEDLDAEIIKPSRDPLSWYNWDRTSDLGKIGNDWDKTNKF